MFSRGPKISLQNRRKNTVFCFLWLYRQNGKSGTVDFFCGQNSLEGLFLQGLLYIQHVYVLTLMYGISLFMSENSIIWVKTTIIIQLFLYTIILRLFLVLYTWKWKGGVRKWTYTKQYNSSYANIIIIMLIFLRISFIHSHLPQLHYMMNKAIEKCKHRFNHIFMLKVRIWPLDACSKRIWEKLFSSRKKGTLGPNMQFSIFLLK